MWLLRGRHTTDGGTAGTSLLSPICTGLACPEWEHFGVGAALNLVPVLRHRLYHGQCGQAGPAEQTTSNRTNHQTVQSSSGSHLPKTLSFSIVSGNRLLMMCRDGRRGQRLCPELLTSSLGCVTPKSSWAASWEKVKPNRFQTTGLTQMDPGRSLL